MKLKIFLGVLLLMSAFCFADKASAMTNAEKQVLIIQIKQKILQLQAELVKLIANCKQNWQCNEWSLCIGGQQSRTCTDLNRCGSDTKKPKVSQTCTNKSAVKIQANNSDGPVNIFLTLGNGAYVTNSGIELTQNINLQWSGVDVASCVASDSLTPKVFSGYKSSLSSQTVALTGILKNVSSSSASSSKITDTFKITCVSTTTGSSVSDSVTVNLFYTINGTCYPAWNCADWAPCASNKQTRTCIDWNGCGSLTDKPIESQSCTVAPAVTLKANGFTGTATVVNGGSVSLSWTSSNATSCVASSDWSGTKSTSGSQKITSIKTAKTFNITCTGAGGSTTSGVTVYVSG